nr:hypothetical protein Q903MT_gene3603 [Picea sitchensis]
MDGYFKYRLLPFLYRRLFSWIYSNPPSLGLLELLGFRKYCLTKLCYWTDVLAWALFTFTIYLSMLPINPFTYEHAIHLAGVNPF